MITFIIMNPNQCSSLLSILSTYYLCAERSIKCLMIRRKSDPFLSESGSCLSVLASPVPWVTWHHSGVQTVVVPISPWSPAITPQRNGRNSDLDTL